MQTLDPSQAIIAALWDMKGTLAFIALAFVGLSILKAFDSRIKGWAGERAVRRALDKGGFKHLHDLYLPSRGGVTQVDHVAMVGRAIVVIETKNYGGWILGGEHQKTWRQCLAGGRVKIPFQNPLRQNHGHRKAVEAVVGPGVEVLGLVVFAPRAHFPKGMPDGVITTDELPKWLRECSRDLSGSSMSAWRQLEDHVGGTDRRASKATHMDTRHKHDMEPGNGRYGAWVRTGAR